MKKEINNFIMKRQKFFVIFAVVFFLGLAIIFGVLVLHKLNHIDYVMHIDYAKELAANGYVPDLPHLLFAQLVIIVRALLPFNLLMKISEHIRSIIFYKSYEIPALIVVVAACLFTAWVLWKRNLNELTRKGFRNASLISMIITTVVMFVSPIFFFTFPGNLYLGYFAPNPSHNPTLILLKPFALIWFYILGDYFFKKANLKIMMVTIVTVILATAAKPSFTLTILPAIALLMLFYIKKWREINWRLLIGVVGIPAVIMLGLQYLVTYSAGAGEKIIFAPFATLLVYSRDLPMVIVKIIMSIAFPLYVTIHYYKTSAREITFRLAWLNFLVGAALAVFFAESTRLTQGNFLWSPYVGVFILFAITVSAYLPDLFTRIKEKTIMWKDTIPAFLLLLHLFCGIFYFVKVLFIDSLLT